MAIPRVVANNIDKLAARLSLVTERLGRLERSAHRHEGGLALQPVGTILDYLGTSVPSSAWVFLEGQTLSNAEANFPALWAIVPASLKSGNSIVLPDSRGRVLVGRNASDTDFDAVGKFGGVKTVSLTTAQLPSHSHSSGTLGAALSGSLSMSGSTNFAGSHVHLVRDYPSQPPTTSGTVGTGPRGQRDNILNGQESSTSGGHDHTVSVSGGSHGHTLSGDTGAAGSGDAHPNLQPFLVTAKILKVI